MAHTALEALGDQSTSLRVHQSAASSHVSIRVYAHSGNIN